MKKIFSTLFFCLAIFAASSTVSFAQSEKENVIAAAKALETAPLAENTTKMAQRALKWSVETTEISLVACGNTFVLFSDKKNKDSNALMTSAYVIGMAAYKLQNPDKTENAVQLAGLETALKAYQVAVKEKPALKSETVGLLLEKQSKGELVSTVNAGECGKK